MRILLKPEVLCALVWLALPNASRGDVGVNIKVDDVGVRDFRVAVGSHFKVSEAAILKVHRRAVPLDHVPVVFFLARHAEVPWEAVVDLRVKGKSWMDISLHFGLGTDVFHVAAATDHGPPYGRALGHFKNRKRSEWSKIRLADEDLVCLVNLKFLVAHHGYSPDEVIRLHGKGGNVVKLHGAVKLHKHSVKRQKASEPRARSKAKTSRASKSSGARGHSGSGGGHGKATGKPGKRGKKR